MPKTSASLVSATIAAKVTEEELKSIREYCSARNSDVSGATRQLWLERLNKPAPDLYFFTYFAEISEKILGALAEGDGKEFVAKFRDWFDRNAESLIAKRIAAVEHK